LIVPTVKPTNLAGLDIIECQCIDAVAAGQTLGCANIGICQIGKHDRIAVRAHIYIAIDNAAAIPSELVIAEAHKNVTRHRPASDRDTVHPTADADIAADHAIGNNDRIIAKPRHQIAIDGAAGHIEIIVVEFHVDATDTATRHHGIITVIKSIDNSAARHEERIQRIPLIERANLAPSHAEIVNTNALLDITGDGSTGNHKRIRAVALNNVAGYRAGMNLYPVCSCTECDIAVDCSASTGRQQQGVIAVRISQTAH